MVLRILPIVLLTILLVSCASSNVKIDNGFIVHEELYRAPTPTNDSWTRAIPAGSLDALYVRCPNEQKILIFYTGFCGRWPYEAMSTDDYINRIYLNSASSYGSSISNILCAGVISRLTDPNFKKIAEPIVDKEKKMFQIVYKTAYSKGRLCSSDNNPLEVKVMDVFFQEPKFHLKGGAGTRFVVLRYVSPSNIFESGLAEFQVIVNEFKWIQSGGFTFN
jgi:hypothetical protein